MRFKDFLIQEHSNHGRGKVPAMLDDARKFLLNRHYEIGDKFPTGTDPNLVKPLINSRDALIKAYDSVVETVNQFRKDGEFYGYNSEVFRWLYQYMGLLGRDSVLNRGLSITKMLVEGMRRDPVYRSDYPEVIDHFDKLIEEIKDRVIFDEVAGFPFLGITMLHYAGLEGFSVNPMKLVQEARKGKGKVSSRAIRDALAAEEKRLVNANKSTIKKSKPVAPFIDMGKYYWEERPNGCREEASTSSHCATGQPGLNGAPSARVKNLLSMRSSVKSTLQRIHLTFVLHQDGYLGEMKGVANSVPKEEYHPQIMRLLLDPAIKGIGGGGWLQSNNFAIQDLSKSQIDKLRKVKGDEFVDHAIKIGRRDRGK